MFLMGQDFYSTYKRTVYMINSRKMVETWRYRDCNFFKPPNEYIETNGNSWHSVVCSYDRCPIN